LLHLLPELHKRKHPGNAAAALDSKAPHDLSKPVRRLRGHPSPRRPTPRRLSTPHLLHWCFLNSNP
jgi:hypothetical protein